VIFHRLRETPQLGLLYFFFNHSNQEQRAEDAIRVLLKQLLRQLPKLPRDVHNQYSKYKRDPHNVMPGREIYENLLKSAVEEFFNMSSNQVFILVDAYDEFRSTQHEERERKCFRSCLLQLSETNKARILVSTRPQYRDLLQESISESRIAEIRGDLIDVERYIDYRLECFDVQATMKDKIKAAILEENRGEAWSDRLVIFISLVLGFYSWVCKSIMFWRRRMPFE
jgi:hypothetical protein